jgi:hypothetical protein
MAPLAVVPDDDDEDGGSRGGARPKGDKEIEDVEDTWRYCTRLPSLCSNA